MPETSTKRRPQIVTVGDPGLWVTLQKVTDKTSGWIKTTRAMQAGSGVLVNTCSRRIGNNIAAEALQFVPGVVLKACAHGFKLSAEGSR